MNLVSKKNAVRLLLGSTLLLLVAVLLFQTTTTDISNTTVFDYIEKEDYAALPSVYQNMINNKLIAAKENPQSLIEKPHFCWAPGTDPKVLDAFESFDANLLNSLWYSLEKFQLGNRWSTTANGGGLGQGDPTTLTWSYPPDGTTIFSCNGETNNSNNMIAFLNGIFGGPTTGGDFTTAPWHQIFVDMFEAWSDVSGLNFVYEPNDDGADFGASGSLGVRGDHRIAGHTVDGNSGILACNAFPNNGDMVIDTGDNFYQNNQGLGTFNVLAHEIGHGLGFAHVCPTSQTKLMEPFITTAFSGPQQDDILAVNRHYGDVDENNNTAGTATNIGTIGVPSTTTRTPRSIDDNSDVDYYQFTTTTASDVTITMTPTGSTYLEQGQDAACNTGASFNALTISNLQVELLASNGTSVLEIGNTQAAGVPESVFRSIAAGTYFARIQQSSSINNVQMYDLEIETIVVPIEVPVANFTATPNPAEFCETSTGIVNFNDTSTGVPSSWAWTFSGAGVSPTSSTEQSPEVTISAAGTLTATLTSTNSLGSSNPLTQTVTVVEIPATDAVCLVSPCLIFAGGPYDTFNYAEGCLANCPTVSAGFQVWENESYRLTGLKGGTTYIFEFCNDYDVATWEAIVTIGQYDLANNNAVANSQIAAEEGCSVTFVCPADGDYIAVVTGKDNCGGAENQTNNGFPTFRCVSGCPSPCGDTFTDRGGENFNYANNSSQVYTICPDAAGQMIEVSFTSFNIEGDSDGQSATDCYDILNVFDGNSTAAPQIGGEFCDSPGPGSPGTVTSTATDGCLTFQFSSDQGVTLAGWVADITCIGGPDCPGNYSLTGTESTTADYETDGTIVSTQTIEATATIDYDSGTDITLNPDFEVVVGAVFCAFIDGCGGNAITEHGINLRSSNTIYMNKNKSDYLSTTIQLNNKSRK